MEQTVAKRRNYETSEKDKARKYYLLGLNLQEVSKLMDIPYKTLEKWHQKYKWKELRKSNNLKGTAIKLKLKGFSTQEISSILRISLTTVWRYCK